MADDAFALSPITARASLPTEADYEAICGAFMETARGRWFLGEYAKRNRNADTRLVLDAIERIEATLATQETAPSASLAELLLAVTELIADTRQRILDGLPKTDIRPATEPIQRAASILRDVAWTLRESGADTRVCDLLDVQAKAIVDGCARLHGDQAIAPDVPATVAAALESLTLQVNALVKSDSPQSPPRAETPVPAEAPVEQARREEVPPAPAEPVSAPAEIGATLDVVGPDEPPAPKHAAEIAETTLPVSEAEAAPPKPAAPLTPLEVDVQANLWEDLEITDVAIDDNLAEPAAVAPIQEPLAPPEATPGPIEAKVAEPVPVLEGPAAPDLTPVVDDAPSAAVDLAEVEAATPLPEPLSRPAPSSLGQAALDSGAIAAPPGRHTDALAPIRRMSQAEKIAFFS